MIRVVGVSGLDDDAVIAGADVAVRDAHVAARIWVNAISIRRVLRIHDAEPVNADVLTQNRMNVPGWRVLNSQTADQDVLRAVEIDHSWARPAQRSIGRILGRAALDAVLTAEFLGFAVGVPPDAACAIECAVASNSDVL